VFAAVALLTASMAGADTTVHAWGLYYGGNGYIPMYVPTGLSNVVTLASGQGHILALRADGTDAWGRACFPKCRTPTVPAGLSNVVAISAGDNQSMAPAPMARSSPGTWACNQYPWKPPTSCLLPPGLWSRPSQRGRAGYGCVSPGTQPTPAGLSNAVMVAAGGYHDLALRADGTVVA
jgi:hypothetical protein